MNESEILQKIATFEVKTLQVADLQAWAKNPRDIEPDQFERLKRDLARYTMLSPLLVDSRDGKTVLGGNMRLKALKELGVKEATCRIVEISDDKEAILVALKDNEAFGKYLEDELKILTMDIPEAQDIQISLSNIEIGEIRDWSAGIGNAESGNEEELQDFLNESEDNMIVKIPTKKEYGEKILEIIKEYADKQNIEDQGLALVELLEQSKYEAISV